MAMYVRMALPTTILWALSTTPTLAQYQQPYGAPQGYGQPTQSQPGYSGQQYNPGYSPQTAPGYAQPTPGFAPQGGAQMGGAGQFDGNYVGALTLAVGQGSCSSGAQRTIVIRNGVVSFTYNPQQRVVLTGPVGPDGSIRLSGPFAGGGTVSFNGQIASNSITGQAQTMSCTYNVSMAKR